MFIKHKPLTVEEESFRKLIVLTLIVSIIPVVLFFVYNFEKTFLFLKSKFGILLILICFCFLVYAHIEPFFLKFNYKEIEIPKEFNEFVAVQITDVHFQWPYPYVTKQKMEKIVKKVNEINPDFVFMTGDYISRFRTKEISEYNTKHVAMFLGKIKAKRGVYAILGNNDRCAGDMIIDEFKKNGIKLLMNESVINDDVSITGIRSSRNLTMCQKHLESVEIKDAPLKIILAHEPDTAQVTNKYFDLQFSGHTHGGQCIAPFGIGPIISPKMGRKFIVNFYRIGSMILHVSTGVGISPLPKPLVRFNNFPEVSVIHVIPA